MLGNGLEKIIQDYLEANGLTGENPVHYTFKDDENGNPCICKWSFEIAKPNFALQDLKDNCVDKYKEIKIRELQDKNKKIREMEYPLQKQIDIQGRINGFTDTDFNTMKTFLNDLVNNEKTKIEEINNCNDYDVLEVLE